MLKFQKMQPNDSSEKPGSAVNLRPDIVANIPLKVQASPLKPVSEDEDLDKIMQDVGKDLKQVDKNHHKKKFFDFKRQPKPAKPPTKPAAVPARPATAQPKPQVSGKPPKQSSAPVLAITVAVLVTFALVAAAYSAYK
jgi:hypothetical protein